MNIGLFTRYRIPLLIKYYQEEFGFTQAWAEMLFGDVVLFLCIRYEQKEKVLPTDTIYKGWLIFMTFTKEYHDFCTVCFGKIIHHQPLSQPQKLTASNLSKIHYGAKLAKQALGDNKNLSFNWKLPPISSGKLPVCKV